MLLIVMIMSMPLLAHAAKKKGEAPFTFEEVKHQLYLGTYKSTKNYVKAKITMRSWGGDNYFTIHVYEKGWFGSTLVTRLGFEKSSKGSPYYDTDYSVKKGNTYIYELWKNRNGKIIKGSGTLYY